MVRRGGGVARDVAARSEEWLRQLLARGWRGPGDGDTDGGDEAASADGRWWRIEDADGAKGPAKVHLYGPIGGWFGLNAKDFIDELNAVTAKNIDLHVNSPGGSVFDGVAIMNSIAAHPATVTAHVDGMAASAASYLIQAADKVVMGRQSQMMIHDALGVCMGNMSDMQEMATLLDRISGDIADVYAESSGKPAKGWRDKMKAETWYSAQEAVDAGLADSVAPKRTPRTGGDGGSGSGGDGGSSSSDEAPQLVAWDLSGYRYAGRDAAPAPVIDDDVHQPSAGRPPRIDTEDLRRALREAFQR